MEMESAPPGSDLQPKINDQWVLLHITSVVGGDIPGDHVASEPPTELIKPHQMLIERIL